MKKPLVYTVLLASLLLVAVRVCAIAPAPFSWLLAAFFILAGLMMHWGLALVFRGEE